MRGREGGNASFKLFNYFFWVSGRDAATLELNHSGIPRTDRFGNADQAKAAEQGWRERIFGAIQVGSVGSRCGVLRL